MSGKSFNPNPTGEQSAANAFGILRQFARKTRPAERCELCSVGLEHEHSHLIEPATRKLLCACDASALLYDGRTDARYKRVPRRAQLLKFFHLTDAQWEDLLIPINMAFFFVSSVNPGVKHILNKRVVALYPSPAGAVESLLSLDAWNAIVNSNPVLNTLQPDVEALLINRIAYSRDAGKAEYFIAPMDECYRLVGLIRAHWKGLSGGTEVWQEIARFFSELRNNAIVVNPRADEEQHA
jgi:hypothetical protein